MLTCLEPPKPRVSISLRGRAQERHLASEIDAHENLQRLRVEHSALLERIREAEGRARMVG